MMKNITMNLKHIVLCFTLAMFAVDANAVTVTYSLTTHVDVRTITGTASVAAGGDLLSSMPQDLWRGYTNYKFYSDAALTEEITVAPAADAIVYVDYEFDPPFILSEEGQDPVWCYFRFRPSSNQRYLYFSQYHYNYNDNYIFYSQNDLSTGTQTLRIRENAQWAIYGDAYSLNLKFNDKNNVATNDYMRPDANSSGWITKTYYPKVGAEKQPGWQLYKNATGNGYFSLVGDEGRFLYDNDNGSYLELKNKESFVSYDKDIIKSNNTANAKDLVYYAFVITPVSSGQNTQEFFHVTYKIQKADGTWYPDYVMQKSSSNLTPAWPPTGFTPLDGYEYDRFYTDANFTQKLVGNMPDGENTVLYVKETEANYVAEQWKTLVLPYSITDLDEYFGTNGVRVLEYTSVQGQLNGDAFRCNLIFTPVDNRIEAYKPYLFKADHVSETVLSGLRHTVASMGEPEEIKLYYSENPDEKIGVAMKGVLTEGGITLPDDGLHFFFGSYPNRDVENYEDYTYKFYRQGGVTIPQFVCYFYVSDERENPSAPIKASFGTESITGVSTIVADIKVQNSIYSLDGRKIDATSLDNLKRGIYIVNGRKVVK